MLLKRVYSKYLLWFLLSLPALPMFYRIFQEIGALAHFVHPTGETAARLTILTLMATPLRMLFPTSSFMLSWCKNRRALGVAAFFYALGHTVAYIYDVASWDTILSEAMTIGMLTGWVSFFIFVPLAITSNDVSVRLLKQSWKKLQRWVYPAALLFLVHWVMVSEHFGGAIVQTAPLAALEIYRIIVNFRRSQFSKAQPSN